MTGSKYADSGSSHDTPEPHFVAPLTRPSIRTHARRNPASPKSRETRSFPVGLHLAFLPSVAPCTTEALMLRTRKTLFAVLLATIALLAASLHGQTSREQTPNT